MMQHLLLVVALCLLLKIEAFFPSASRWATQSPAAASSSASSSRLSAQIDPKERNPFGSKLMQDVTEDELEELFREFNITNFSIEKDPELLKWAPSKEFFERFGFQNNTERYKRKTMDVKIDFYAAYRRPILPQYKTFIADVMSMTFVQSMDSRYKYDALHAFGICTQYYTIMKGYALQDEVRYMKNSLHVLLQSALSNFLVNLPIQ